MFRPRCLLCDGPGQFPCLDLCARCDSELPRMPERCCIRCALPLETAEPAADCADCRATAPPYAGSIAAFRYADPVDRLVKDLKYRGHLSVARVLGEMLAARVAASEHEYPETAVDLLLPVPLHPSRLSERGFNQSLEIARWCARRLGLPLAPRLAARRRATAPQAGMPQSERGTNLRGAFTATPAARRMRVAVVDDVVTTGETVKALATALLEAGAASVSVYCVARALQSAPGRPLPGAAGVRLGSQQDSPVRA